MRKSLLFVSAQMPGPRLSWIQLPRTSAPLTDQNFMAPLHPQPGTLCSQSWVLLPVISLPSTTSPVMPLPGW